ncbi:unnamed protein product [Trichobilharzia regenti]|nr:unnamed protein product [Trichobilharzia regenti]
MLRKITFIGFNVFTINIRSKFKCLLLRMVSCICT